MPINNPPINQGAGDQNMLLLEEGSPTYPPPSAKVQWVDILTGRLWISKDTESVEDWIEITQLRVEVLDRILVANGDVLTDGQNVLYK